MDGRLFFELQACQQEALAKTRRVILVGLAHFLDQPVQTPPPQQTGNLAAGPLRQAPLPPPAGSPADLMFARQYRQNALNVGTQKQIESAPTARRLVLGQRRSSLACLPAKSRSARTGGLKADWGRARHGSRSRRPRCWSRGRGGTPSGSRRPLRANCHRGSRGPGPTVL